MTVVCKTMLRYITYLACSQFKLDVSSNGKGAQVLGESNLQGIFISVAGLNKEKIATWLRQRSGDFQVLIGNGQEDRLGIWDWDWVNSWAAV